MAKRKPKQPSVKSKSAQEAGEAKVMRLAHKILTKTIWPANLKLEDAIEVLALVAKGLVLTNTSDEDPADRSRLIDVIGEHFLGVLMEIDPLVDRNHLWLVPPQGLITEPFGILWDGGYEEDSVKGMLGAELEALRTEAQAEGDLIVIEGVDGVAATVPDWDGKDIATCENPECGRIHNVHLTVAEDLFQQSIERRQQRLAAN